MGPLVTNDSDESSIHEGYPCYTEKGEKQLHQSQDHINGSLDVMAITLKGLHISVFIGQLDLASNNGIQANG